MSEFGPQPIHEEALESPEVGDTVLEVSEAYERCGAPLSEVLHEMLRNEEQHQGGRRGSGFTQASRELASMIRHERDDRDQRLFNYEFCNSLDEARLAEWDQSVAAAQESGHDSYDIPMPELNLRSRLNLEAIRQIPDQMVLEESKVLGRMLGDIIEPYQPTENDVVLPSSGKKMEVGTCTTAEVYFLDFIEQRNQYPGHFNAITQNGEIVMLEKIGMGEDHSCITIKESVINGVRIPEGSLVAVEYEDTAKYPWLNDHARLKNYLSVDDCKSFEFLRLSPLAISPENRERAFTTHVTESRNNENLKGLETATLDDLRTRITESFDS